MRAPRPIVEVVPGAPALDLVAGPLLNHRTGVYLRTGRFDSPAHRHSYLVSDPVAVLHSRGARSVIRSPGLAPEVHFGNPWPLLDSLLERYELVDDLDQPHPVGGAFGFWGYELNQFVEPRVPRRAVRDQDLPDACIGFFPSLLIRDHLLDRTWIVATGLGPDGSRSATRARRQRDTWMRRLEAADATPPPHPATVSARGPVSASAGREEFIATVRRAQAYIRSGDIYQVNLSRRLSVPLGGTAWELFERLLAVSPAPYAAFQNWGGFQLVSSSPELFLRLSGRHAVTRPIKGTRPRSPDPVRDAQLTYELQRSAKEMAELVMITDLLRNDLGRICEYGSVTVPELVRLERFAHVQHLVSTVEGRLRPDVGHAAALASMFPGGSVTGAPKIRAMEIIDELEPVARGPYCGAHGCLGFNRESQLSITIRTAVVRDGIASYHTGAGIVADSDPEAEFDETTAKARGFLEAISVTSQAPGPGVVPPA